MKKGKNSNWSYLACRIRPISTETSINTKSFYEITLSISKALPSACVQAFLSTDFSYVISECQYFAC